MIKHLIVILTFFTSSAVCAQEIQYQFGRESDVIDSVKSVINKFKKMYSQEDVAKLNLYAGLYYEDGSIYLNISQYVKDGSNGMFSLVRKTNRIIRVDSKFSLPVIFETDILSADLKGEVGFIHMGGYCIKISKNEHRIWKVARVQVTF